MLLLDTAQWSLTSCHMPFAFHLRTALVSPRHLLVTTHVQHRSADRFTLISGSKEPEMHFLPLHTVFFSLSSHRRLEHQKHSTASLKTRSQHLSPGPFFSLSTDASTLPASNPWFLLQTPAIATSWVGNTCLVVAHPFS